MELNGQQRQNGLPLAEGIGLITLLREVEESERRYRLKLEEPRHAWQVYNLAWANIELGVATTSPTEAADCFEKAEELLTAEISGCQSPRQNRYIHAFLARLFLPIMQERAVTSERPVQAETIRSLYSQLGCKLDELLWQQVAHPSVNVQAKDNLALILGLCLFARAGDSSLLAYKASFRESPSSDNAYPHHAYLMRGKENPYKIPLLITHGYLGVIPPPVLHLPIISITTEVLDNLLGKPNTPDVAVIRITELIAQEAQGEQLSSEEEQILAHVWQVVRRRLRI